MTDQTVIQYKIFCQTDNRFELTWRDEAQGPPTTCPVNTAHTVILDSVSVEDEISTTKVQVQEESIPTGGHFRTESILIHADPKPTDDSPPQLTYTDLRLPVNCSMLALKFSTQANQNGDVVENSIAPNTIVGALIAPTTPQVNIIGVSPTVFNYLEVGYHLNIFNPVSSQYQDLGRALSLNPLEYTVTTEFPPTEVFEAYPPTYVRMTVYNVKNYHLSNAKDHVIGDSKIGGSFIPANTLIQIEYYNNSTEPKDMVGVFEYLY